MGSVQGRVTNHPVATCDLCGCRAPNPQSDYVFFIRGRGKYDGRVACEACLAEKLRGPGGK